MIKLSILIVFADVNIVLSFSLINASLHDERREFQMKIYSFINIHKIRGKNNFTTVSTNNIILDYRNSYVRLVFIVVNHFFSL